MCTVLSRSLFKNRYYWQGIMIGYKQHRSSPSPVKSKRNNFCKLGITEVEYSRRLMFYYLYYGVPNPWCGLFSFCLLIFLFLFQVDSVFLFQNPLWIGLENCHLNKWYTISIDILSHGTKMEENRKSQTHNILYELLILLNHVSKLWAKVKLIRIGAELNHGGSGPQMWRGEMTPEEAPQF